jgi:hypothetical protein
VLDVQTRHHSVHPAGPRFGPRRQYESVLCSY